MYIVCINNKCVVVGTYAWSYWAQFKPFVLRGGQPIVFVRSDSTIDEKLNPISNSLIAFLPHRLKVLSSDMDPANLCSFHRSSLKEASQRLFRKIRPSLIEWEPFNARAPSRTIIAHYALNSQMRSKAHTTLTSPLVLHHTRIYKCAMKKININCQMRNKHFFYCLLLFFTGKSRYECCPRLLIAQWCAKAEKRP
jgi:hypothetical protein